MKRQRGATVEKECQQCGTAIWAQPSRADRKKYCSHSCRQKWRRANEAGPPPVPMGTKLGPRLRPDFHPDRACRKCFATYSPTASNQKWCVLCAPDKKSRAMLRRYGVSRPEWEAMLELTGGMCAICRVKEATVLDHDHATGDARGPLCITCNMTLGIWERQRIKNPEWDRRAREYVAIF